MAIDIGDAILTFRGDTTQLDATFGKVGAEAEAKMVPAAQATQKLEQEIKQVGTTSLLAGEQAVVAGTEIAGAAELSRETIHEAKGEAALLGEAFGIHLPRHVRSFIAELPGVGQALSAAFAATAVLFIIDALVQVVEKIKEFANAQKEINEAMERLHTAQEKTFHDLEDNLIRAQLKTAELTGDHLEALRLKLLLIDNSTLGKLRGELEKLGQEADKDFEKFQRNWFSQFFLGLEGGGKAKENLDEVGKAVDKALSERTPESFAKAMKLVDDAVGEATAKLKSLDDQQKENERRLLEMAKTGRDNAAFTGGKPVDPRTIQSWNELRVQLQEYKRDIEEAQKAEQKEQDTAKLQERLKQLEEQKTLAKSVLDARMLAIQQTESAEKAAFAQGKISAAEWSQAQIKAANDSADAQIKYKQQLAFIAAEELQAAKAVDENASSLKARTAAQDAANEKVKQQNKLINEAAEGLLKAHNETTKLRAEMEKIVFPADKVKDQAQAFKELDAAETKLAEAEKQLALLDPTREFERQKQAIRDLATAGIVSKEVEAARLQQLDEEEAKASSISLKEQQAAIQSLAHFRLISKEQESALLARAQQSEGQRQLDVLKKSLAEQEQTLEAARARFLNATKDALFPPDQLARLKAELDLAQAAWDKTQTEILKRKDQDNSKLLALDRSHYGQALALFLAFGKQEEAEQLKLVHGKLEEAKASLHTAQANLAEAKARGLNTKAMQDEVTQLEKLIKELKKEETELEHDAKKGLTAWKQFGAGFRQEAEQNRKSLEQMGAAMEQDVQALVSNIGDAFQAMVEHQESFGQAMEAATLRMISNMAKQWAEYFAAKAIADIFWNPALGAAEFAAAAALFAVSGALGGAASNVESKGSSSSASQGTPVPAAGSPNVTSGSAPAQTVNVPHFASGAIVTKPTLAVVGDSPSGGRAREAILNLDDPQSMAILKHALGGAGTVVNHHWQIEGLVSADHVRQFTRMINSEVEKGTVRLTASKSRRIERRG